jgi:hypothetical protein
MPTATKILIQSASEYIKTNDNRIRVDELSRGECPLL